MSIAVSIVSQNGDSRRIVSVYYTSSAVQTGDGARDGICPTKLMVSHVVLLQHNLFKYVTD